MDKIQALLSFLEQDPDDHFTRFALALEHVKLGDDEQAKRWFLDILSRDEHYIGVYYHLGILHSRGGDTEKALDTFTRGIALARSLGDHHAASELEAAKFELT